MGFLEDFEKAMKDAQKKSDEFKKKFEEERKKAEEDLRKKFHLKEIEDFCNIWGGVNSARNMVERAERGELSEKEGEELRQYLKETGQDLIQLKKAIDVLAGQ